MQPFPKNLTQKLESRKEADSLRSLTIQNGLIDFSSNDYLGFAQSKTIFDTTHAALINNNIFQNGATGSRLLSGNHETYAETELFLANYHNAESALLFNSGYDANIGFFSSIPQRGDVILYDEYIHASIRDGMQMSLAKSYKFKHNDLNDLEKKLNKYNHKDQEVYVVSESVFSMDGDSPDLVKLTALCAEKMVHLIIDEAHAIGVFGATGGGLLQKLKLENAVFARIITFGKAMGCHGAAVIGSKQLKNFLINFARSFIYTTGLPPHSLATIRAAYSALSQDQKSRIRIHENNAFFVTELKRLQLEDLFISSNSAIHCAIISGNKNVKELAVQFQERGFDVKPIRSPTVPKGQERIRFCLHSYNSFQEITDVLSLLAIFVAR